MLHDIVEIMRAHPELVIFIALALGYFFGKRLKIGGFRLGTTVCVLLAALVVGQIGVDVPPLLRSLSFALFIFCIGYKVGPQFFGALKSEGVGYILVTMVVAASAVLTVVVIGKLMHFGQGTTAGIFAGSMTTSAALGTADGAIGQLSITDSLKAAMNANVAVAYAITYIFGTAGAIIIIKFIPRILKVDLRAEAKILEKKMGVSNEGDEGQTEFRWASQLELRAYKAANAGIIGKTVGAVEALFPSRVAIDRIARGGACFDTQADTVVEAGDTLIMMAGQSAFLKACDTLGPETDPSDDKDMSGETMEVCVLNKDVVGKTLGELSKDRSGHGVFLRRITRQGHEIPIAKDLVIHKCDIMQFIGGKDDVERVVKNLGYAERPTSVTDLATVAVGCILGTLLGLIVVPVAGLPITLGTGGGILVAGLLFGWIRSLHPTFGQIPSGAQWIMSDFCLNLFIACVGITAGPEAVHAFKTSGLAIFLTGIAVTTIPIIVGYVFGRKVLKMNILLLLGSLTGAHNVTAALDVLTEDSGSSVSVIAYAVPYAFANVVLTIMGSFIVNLM